MNCTFSNDWKTSLRFKIVIKINDAVIGTGPVGQVAALTPWLVRLNDSVSGEHVVPTWWLDAWLTAQVMTPSTPIHQKQVWLKLVKIWGSKIFKDSESFSQPCIQGANKKQFLEWIWSYHNDWPYNSRICYEICVNIPQNIKSKFIFAQRINK